MIVSFYDFIIQRPESGPKKIKKNKILLTFYLTGGYTLHINAHLIQFVIK